MIDSKTTLVQLGGFEPPTSGSTDRQVRAEINVRFDSRPENGSCKATRFDSSGAKVESQKAPFGAHQERSEPEPYNGLANRRLQPLGHLSNGRNPYSSSVSGSNGPCDSGDSADSCDSGEVAKEVTCPSPANLLDGLAESQKPAPDAAPRMGRPPGPHPGRRSQKESQNSRVVRIPTEVLDRLTPHAEARRCTVNDLIRHLVEIVLDDGLITAVLDDAS